MSKSSSSLDQKTFKKLSRLYIIALSAIAISVIVSQILIQKHLNDQQNDSTVINVAGRQRMLSQKLAKEAILLSISKDSIKKISNKNTFEATLSLWESSHKALQKGDKNLGLPYYNSETVTRLYNQINPIFNNINAASKRIIQKIETSSVLTTQDFIDDIKIIEENEGSFLTIMDQIVNAYDDEAEDKINWLRNLEMLLTALTVLILLAELIFVFLPTAKTVRNSISKLLTAESKAVKMAAEADELSAAKEKSIKELRALTRAMDETLLFARIKPNGNIVEIGNKISRLFGFNKNISNFNFSEVISSNENEQLIIENLISKHKKIGWQGEVKASTKQNEDVWLEMAIIPFNTLGNSSELLIIASDITHRKEAQLEIERLNEVNFAEKMNQQKIISSQIIENQENEQKRIAKDVHDGIGQMLTGLKYNLESIDFKHVEKAEAKVEQLKHQAEDIIKGVRTATFNLAPPELTDHGVVSAITKLTQELTKFTGKNIVLYSKTNFNQRLDSLVEINIYRITQEAINNAIKYADSTHIIVTITHTEKMLSIVIDDNGKGFNPNKVEKKKNGDGGMGLTFMQERITYVNGRIFINSAPNKGTKVTLNVPL